MWISCLALIWWFRDARWRSLLNHRQVWTSLPLTAAATTWSHDRRPSEGSGRRRNHRGPTDHTPRNLAARPQISWFRRRSLAARSSTTEQTRPRHQIGLPPSSGSRLVALAPQPPKTPTYAGFREWSAGRRVRSRHDPDRHRRGVRGDAGRAGGRAGGGVPDGGDDRQPRAAARADARSRTCRPTRSRRRRTGSARSTPTSRSRRRRRSRGWPRPWLPYDATTGGSCWSPASTRPTPSCTSTTSASTSTSSRDGCGGPARARC